MLFVGVDPDLHNTGIAALDENERIVYIETVAISKDLRGVEAAAEMCRSLGTWFSDPAQSIKAAIEFPIVYASKMMAKESICLLDLVAGGAAAALAPEADVWFTKPQEWKGQIEKSRHHRIIMDRAGLRPSDRHTSHETDALGLAQWALDQWKKRQLREKYLGE